MAALPNLQWNHLLDVSLIECITNRHLNFDASGHPATRAGREAFLTAIGITPADCFGAVRGHQIPVQQPNRAPTPKVQLKEQQDDESIDDFLDRAADYMRVSNLNNALQILTLQNAISGGASATIHELMSSGTDVYADIVTSLKARYATPKFVLMERYQSLQKLPNESVCCFGQKLRVLFIRYLGIPAAQLAVHEPFIKQVLLARILPTLNNNIRVQAQATFDSDPQVTLEVLLARVDGFCTYARSSGNISHSRTFQNKSESLSCPNHPFSNNHSLKDCRLTRSTADKPNSSSRNRNRSTRFRSKEGQTKHDGVIAAVDGNKSDSENSN
jgi:hypothetical protein